MNYWNAVEFGDSRKNTSSESGRSSHKRHTYHSEYSHSKSSLLSVMERFVRAVDDMNSTILVPSRLLDMDTGDAVNSLGSSYSSIEPFQFYSTLNKVKNELMWGSGAKDETPQRIQSPADGSFFPILPSVASSSSSGSSTSSAASVSSKTSTGPGSPGAKVNGHVRRPSTVSTISSSSGSNSMGSDIEFSELNDDSGVEVEDEYSLQLSDSFRHHLQGLHKTLSEFATAASYITTKYNTEFGYEPQN